MPQQRAVATLNRSSIDAPEERSMLIVQARDRPPNNGPWREWIRFI
jgi:hypothetical protein